MNKKELVSSMAEKIESTHADAERALNAFTSTVIDTVAKGEKVDISGFGSFERKTRAARTGINPATGAKIQIPETNVPAFKAAKAFKEVVKLTK